MTPTKIQEKEILKEYYSFLYDLASKKKYLHASQLTDEERKYCEKLLGSCNTKLKSNELYLPLMENILRNHYSETSD